MPPLQLRFIRLHSSLQAASAGMQATVMRRSESAYGISKLAVARSVWQHVSCSCSASSAPCAVQAS